MFALPARSGTGGGIARLDNHTSNPRSQDGAWVQQQPSFHRDCAVCGPVQNGMRVVEFRVAVNRKPAPGLPSRIGCSRTPPRRFEAVSDESDAAAAADPRLRRPPAQTGGLLCRIRAAYLLYSDLLRRSQPTTTIPIPPSSTAPGAGIGGGGGVPPERACHSSGPSFAGYCVSPITADR